MNYGHQPLTPSVVELPHDQLAAEDFVQYLQRTWKAATEKIMQAQT